MKKWLVPLIGLTIALALGTVGAVTAFALTSDGGSDNPQVPNVGDTAGEVLHGDPTYDDLILDFGDGIGDGKVITSADDIDPNVCNPVNNINACTLEEVFRAFTDIASVETHGNTEPLVSQVVITSIDDIDPDVCNLVHNIEACSQEERGEAFGAVDTASVTRDGEVGCVAAHDLEDGGEELVTSSQPPTVEPLPAPAT